MVVPVTKAMGEHTLITDPVVRWDVEFSDTSPPSVVMTALLQVVIGRPIFPPPSGNASVAVQMDAQVAIDLYEQLGQLGRSMGWLAP